MITPSESFAGSDKESGLKSSLSSPVASHLVSSSSPAAPRQNLLPSLPSLGFLALPIRPPPPQSAPASTSNRPQVHVQQTPGFSHFTFSPNTQKSNISPASISSTAQTSRYPMAISSAPYAVPISGSPNAVRIVSPPSDGYFRAPQVFNFGSMDLGISSTANAVLEPRTEQQNLSGEQKAKKQKPEKVASRTRLEWSETEEATLLQGLNAHGPDFERIHQILPSRSRTQIRTHYRYLAHSLVQNQQAEAQSLLNLGVNDSNGKQLKMRRLRVRGRPPVGGKGAALSSTTVALLRTVEQIERQRLFSAKNNTTIISTASKQSNTVAGVAAVLDRLSTVSPTHGISAASSSSSLSSSSTVVGSNLNGLAQLSSSLSSGDDDSSSTDSGVDLSPQQRSPPQLSALIPNRAAFSASEEDHSGFGALSAAAAALASVAGTKC